ncbi:hypothetical protein RHODO2019_18345 (plasmid) [Rhodococcus antarcticus]|uniref:Uncharacterized protein n=1 Tax=Rhodococcus antarcticus TaxID=2987751 RepID=A0ABY6P6U4_9NOCA|nr:hypothetical protein [Rhodococcus antarcticus]UZJ26843.1 hypothetical protein RHODO2019_18345 [Rhodococcus antarcticus]
MPTFTASVDGGDDDDDAGLTEEQRAALVRAFSTPAFTRSMEQLRQQISSPLEGALQQLNQQVTAGVTAQLEPVLRASRLRNEALMKAIQPQLSAQVAAPLRMRAVLEPMFAQIAERQREWAKALAVPLMANAHIQSQLAGLAVNSEFTRSLDRVSALSRLRLELPDAAGFDRLSELIDEGEFDAETLSAAEDGVAADAELSAAIDEAAEVLSEARPWISRVRARQMVVVWVWLMWTAALTVVAVAAPSTIATYVSLAGLPAGKEAAKRAGEQFDRRFPPEDEPVGG